MPVLREIVVGIIGLTSRTGAPFRNACGEERMTLKELREQSKSTATDVAKVLGVTQSAVSNYEKGIRRVSLEQVLLLSAYYDCTSEEIIKAQLNSCQGQ